MAAGQGKMVLLPAIVVILVGLTLANARKRTTGKAEPGRCSSQPAIVRTTVRGRRSWRMFPISVLCRVQAQTTMISLLGTVDSHMSLILMQLASTYRLSEQRGKKASCGVYWGKLGPTVGQTIGGWPMSDHASTRSGPASPELSSFE